MFLPDRFIKGECPNCGAPDQYGDNCESCGAVYAPTDLKNPRSALTGATPVLRSSEHFFFRLSDPRCVDFLEDWTQDGRLQPEVANKVREWFKRDEARPGEPGRLGHQPRRALLRHRDPRRAGQVFLRLARRAGGLPGFAEELVRQDRRRLRRLPRRPRGGADPLHRQGHRHLPHAVLAGDAEVQRPQGARPRLRARPPHRERRQDEQEPRHRHQPAALPGARPRRRVAALLHLRQAQRPRRGPRLQPRRLRRPRQRRPGGQVHQHRQPRRGLPEQALRRPAVGRRGRGRPRAARRPARPGRHAAGPVRGSRVRQGAARGDGCWPTA